jgi:flagellar P-ring protein precursor FlgI
MDINSRQFVIRVVLPLFLAAGFTAGQPANAERIKDIASIQGVRQNQLVGYGLVVGLDGSGDQTTQTPFTIQSMGNMLTQLGITIPAGTNPQLKNVAAVMVTTSLPPFAKPGQSMDVTVSSIGNSKSLRGGTLLLTPLKGVDGQVYAMAQGNLVISGAGASANGAKVQVNQLNAGRVPNGATVERAVASPFVLGEKVVFELNTTDFSRAQQLSESINNRFGAGTANPVDGRVIEVQAPASPAERVAFVSEVENLQVGAVSGAAKVVINARTGSVVMNRAVKLEPFAVAHGSLSIVVSTDTTVSQPNALAGGQTAEIKKSEIQIRQEPGALMMLPGGADLSEVVKALSVLGANPQDLLAILQAMKAAGALRAELEII